MNPRDTLAPSPDSAPSPATRAALWFGGAALIALACALWLRMADAVFLERLVSALAGCF